MKPILFNTEMVKAIIDDLKTVTRRVVKPQPKGQLVPMPVESCWRGYFGEAYSPRAVRPPCFIDDILYVRETWQYAYNLDDSEHPIDGTGRYLYAADNEPEPFDFWVNPDGTHRDSMPWRPSIHMPREAARIFLRVTDVRVERVAWRIVKDWVEAQMAILESEMVQLDEIFLPYMVARSGQTLFEAYRDNQLMLPE